MQELYKAVKFLLFFFFLFLQKTSELFAKISHLELEKDALIHHQKKEQEAFDSTRSQLTQHSSETENLRTELLQQQTKVEQLEKNERHTRKKN